MVSLGNFDLNTGLTGPFNSNFSDVSEYTEIRSLLYCTDNCAIYYRWSNDGISINNIESVEIINAPKINQYRTIEIKAQYLSIRYVSLGSYPATFRCFHLFHQTRQENKYIESVGGGVELYIPNTNYLWSILSPDTSINISGVTGAVNLETVGITGATGPDGLTGATGQQGATGDQGATGPAGATGAIGPTGAMMSHIMPVGEIAYQDHVTPTTISVVASSTPYLINVATTLNTSNTSGASPYFDMPSNGRLRFIGTNTQKVHCALSIDVQSAGGANKIWSFSIYKNGVFYPRSRYEIENPGTNEFTMACHIVIELATNDYLECWFENLSDTSDLIVHNFNLVCMGTIGE